MSGTDKTPAERTVERLDSYTPEEHMAAIRAAREMVAARRASRSERAQAAAARLRKKS